MDTIGQPEWVWWRPSRGPGSVGRVLERQELYGSHTVTLYTPSDQRVQTIAASDLEPVSERTWSSDEVLWRLLSTRLELLLAQGQPLLGEDRVTLLPHQSEILCRAVAMSPVRLAICCEVGLGKTTTAGAIVSELRSRGRIRRVLVVAPKGVQLQWVAEMRDKFGLEFTRIGPEGVPMTAPEVWKAFDLVVTSIDAVKPLRRRSGWDTTRIDAYNETRFAGMSAGDWDLVIIDEAHHVAGSSADVARHQLAAAVADRTPNVLLLTATPHSGKSEAFRRFLSLVDPDFGAGRPVNAGTIAPVMARTAKRGALDNAGRNLFRPRVTTLEEVPWSDGQLHREVYDAVTEWVREGYAAAQARGDRASGFLLLLFQRLVASSTAALISAMGRRRDALLAKRLRGTPVTEEALELEGEEIEEFLEAVGPLDGEMIALDHLLGLAREATSRTADPKTLHFITLLQRLRQSEQDAGVKILIFTQFRGTQEMLRQVLTGAGVSCTLINGDLGLQERQEAQRSFAEESQILISTDAGGEGVNLQFAHVVVNWDLPWSPTLVEQRIGRVDRIGQKHTVQAINFVLEDSVEQRVVEVLESKLETILAELGVDKRSDVLESSSGLVDSLYVAAIVDPDRLDEAAAIFESDVRDALTEEAESRSLLDEILTVAPPVRQSPVPEVSRRVRHVAAALKMEGEPLTAALDDHCEFVDSEPAAILESAEVGWLVIVRVSDNRAASGFAVLLRDSGTVDPMAGDRIWAELITGPVKVVGVQVVPAQVYEAARQAVGDYAYRTLNQLAGTNPETATARIALIVRLSGRPSL